MRPAQNGTDVVDAVRESNLVELIPANLPDLPSSIEEEVDAAREKAEAIVIDSEESANAALAFVKVVKTRAAEIKAERFSLTRPRKAAADEIKHVYDGLEAPFLEVEGVVKGRLAAWEDEVKEQAATAQRLIDEERERVEAKARADREAAEQAAKEAADLAAEADDEEDAEAAAELEAEARREAELAGVHERAIGSLPAQAPAAAPKLSGFSRPKQLVAKVVDFAALPDTLPDGTPLKVVDEVALRRWAQEQAKANGGELPMLPGAEFTREASGSSVRT